MKSLCFHDNPEVILDSPDRNNIKISVMCIPNKDKLEKVFSWLLDILKVKKEKTERHIIFCESIGDVSKIYSAFMKELGGTSLTKLFDMFHSKTNQKVKDNIRKDMISDGNIRVLICTNAAGMGVNFYGVHNIVHYNLPRQFDTFVQQMGRAGRDGQLSHELLLYKTHQAHLKKVDNELVRLAKDDTSCKHELICASYLMSRKAIVPSHDCCDICAEKCKCQSQACPRKHPALKAGTDYETDSSEDEMERHVTDNERKQIQQRIETFQFTLMSSSSGTIVDSDVLHGLTNEVVASIVANCSKIFTSEDIMRKYPIWSMKTAIELCSLINDILGDTDMYNLLADTEVDSN